MHIGLTAVEAKKSVTYPRARPAHGSTINRHPTTPVSPIPLDIPLAVPIQQNNDDSANDIFLSGPKFTRGSKRELSSNRKNRQRFKNIAENFQSLPPIRSNTAIGRFYSQELPQIQISAAPQCSRDQQKPGYHQVKGKMVKISMETDMVQNKAVTIPAHRTGDTPQNKNTYQAKQNDSRKATDKSLCLKSIDLNKELEAASGGVPKGTNLTIALSRKPIVQRKRPQLTDEKHDLRVVSLSHLPLREVYLKPENANTKDIISRQNKDRMMRILKWLKDLSYLDDKAVEKGRTEVERSHFELPEIKDPILIV